MLKMLGEQEMNLVPDWKEYLDTSYYYYRDEYVDITIAYRRKRTRDHIIYGASFCHPIDQFSKKLGRKIAEGRMNKPTTNSCGEINVDKSASRFEVHDRILIHIESMYPHGPTF